MRIALGLDVAAAPSFAAVIPLEPHARPRMVPAPTLTAPTSGRIDAVVDAAIEAIAVVTDLEAEAPSAVALVHPLAWESGQVLRLYRALTRAGLHHIGVLSSAQAAAVDIDSRHPALNGHRVTVVALRPDGAEVQGLSKDGKNSFRELGERLSVEGVPEAELNAALLALVNAQLAKKLPVRADDPAVRSALEALDASISKAREKLNYDDTASIGVRLPGRASVVQLQRDAFQRAVAPVVLETLPPLVAAIRSASAGGPPAQQLILTGTAAPAPLLADLLRAEFGVPVIVAGPHDGGSFGGALVAAAAAAALEPAPLVLAASTGSLSVFADPIDREPSDEFADDPDPVTEKRRRPLTLLRLWPITAAAAVLVALAGTASSGALDLTPAGSHPATGTTAPADRGTGSAADSSESGGATPQTPRPTVSVPAGSSDTGGDATAKKHKKPAPTTKPVAPVEPVVPVVPPDPAPAPTESTSPPVESPTPTPTPSPSDTTSG